MAAPGDISGKEANRIDLSARLEEWRRLLLDTSKRSRLVNSKFGRGGVLGIEHPDFYKLWEQFAVESKPAEFPWPSQWIDIDEQVKTMGEEGLEERPSDPRVLSATQLAAIKQSPELNNETLLTNLPDKPLDGRLKRLALVASTSLSEQGVNSLFLAFGFLQWFESADSDVPILSPLVLLPVSLRRKSADSTWELAPLDDDVASNHPLAEILRADFRLTLPQISEDELSESSAALESLLSQIESVIAGHDRWQVQRKVGLGTFAFQKISMWQDLGKNADRITGHPLCRGIAGDSSQMPTTDMSDVLNSDLDQTVPPETSYLILDCDSSQLAAIEMIQRGHHLILDGPPGTGKSQTITNIIARSIANNKTVLFVSEKAAALEVVKRRLDQSKLGDFCLECHSHKANKRAVVEELGRCLNREAEVYPPQDHKMAELRRTRQKLNEYVRALHAKRSALNQTAYSIHGRLAKIRTSLQTRLSIADIHAIDAARLQEMEEGVAQLANCKAIIVARGIHPWRGCRAEFYSLTLPDDIRFHFSRAAAGLGKRLEASRPLEGLGFLSARATLKDLAVALDTAAAVLTQPPIPQSWVEAGLMQTAEKYIALHELAQDYRILWSSSMAYVGDATIKIDMENAKAVSASFTKLKTWMSALPATLRQQAVYVEGICAQLKMIAELADKLDGAAHKLRQSLALSATYAPTSREADELAANALHLTGLSLAKPQWFDATDRKRLRPIVADAKQIAAMAGATRRSLESTFLATAFEPIAVEQIETILHHRGWFARFGNSWRRAKQNFGLLYTGQSPQKSRQLLDDAFQLNRYHQYAKQLEAKTVPDRDTLAWDGQLNFDWDSVLARLDVIDLLPTDLQNNESAKTIATAVDSAPRAQLALQAQRIREHFRDLSSAVNKAAHDITFREAFETESCIELPPATLKFRATDLAMACLEHIALLKAIFPLIEVERDVAIDALPKDFEVLTELQHLSDRAKAITAALGEKLPELKMRSLGDWKDRADLATSAIAFLKQHNGTPPAHFVRAISEHAVRTALSAAVEKTNLAHDSVLRNSSAFVDSLFPQDIEVSVGVTLSHVPISELIEWLNDRARDADRVSEWVNYINTREKLRHLGMELLHDEILDGSVNVDEAIAVLRQRFYRLWLAESYRSEPALNDFDPAQHDQTLSRFQDVDRFWVKNGFAQVRSKVLSNAPRLSGNDDNAPGNSEVGILLREVNKRRRHLPIRRLFSSMPSLLQKLKPCIMMSPLAVSTYLDNSDIRFDVVIFDEASQVRPHDAICAIYRGSQLVVAGDQKQLPPTNFFERLGSEDEDDDELENASSDYESILDMCRTLGMPRQRLKWHYRSRRESLIAFSNRHFYGSELVTFPSVQDVDGSSGVAFCLIENGRWAGAGAGGVNQVEAERIADAVIRHASEQPDKSLGVITMNQPQQMLVIELIDKHRRASLHLEQFFSTEKPEPFFVKNLENVQGDERDVIFLGVGYAKNDTGILSHNFGPLNRQGGERRLNVAITRARQSLTVFTSIQAADIDLSRTQARGAALLRAYLDFAERGRVALAATETEDSAHDFDSDFEAEVARALTEQGLDVRRQIGCSGFRIDLALIHPDHSGKYVLGIECDGAAYHRSATARDRDRLRQEVLENLGWKICRIWSTDWIRDSRRQIQKVLDAYQRALAVTEVGSLPAKEVETVTPVQAANRPTGNGPIGPQFDAIDDVPRRLMQNVLTDAIQLYGAMPIEDLIQAAARKLGFHRTGSRIRDRLADEIKILEKNGAFLTGSDGRLRSPASKGGA
ncbi:MAG: DUF4011 domain-containing protein [Tepidisphaeraceae bacterium]